MATIQTLNADFKASFTDKASKIFSDRSLPGNASEAAKKALLEGADNASGFLKKRVAELDKWALEEDASRGRLIKRLQKIKPSDSELEEYKKTFKKNHEHALEQLQNQHARQLHQLEAWFKDNPGFNPVQQEKLIQAWKTTQAEQINALEQRHQADQNYLTHFKQHYDKMVASRKILRAACSANDKDKKNKRIVQDYHFSPFSFIKKKIDKSDTNYDTAGELDIKYAEKFNLYETLTGKREIEKKEANLREQLIRNNEETLSIAHGSIELLEDWESLSNEDDFFNKDEHVYTNLGTSTFGGIGPFKEEIVVKLHQSVPADKKRGLPAAEGVIYTVCDKNASIEKKRIFLGILANEAMAQGWTSVNLGRLPADLHEEAYLAFRRAGFSHDQLEINGRPFSPNDRLKGNEARERIDNAYEKKAKQDERDELTKLTDLMFQTSEIDEKLKPAVFFNLTKDEQIELFGKASPIKYYEPHIAILSEASIPDESLKAYIKALVDKNKVVELLVAMPMESKCQLDKLTAAFDAIEPEAKKIEVFKELFENTLFKEDKAISKALCAILNDSKPKFAAKLLNGLDSNLNSANQKAIQFLRNGLNDNDLSAKKVYDIYKNLNLDDAALNPILFSQNLYPWQKNPDETIKFMAAIIVGGFLEQEEGQQNQNKNNKNQRKAFKLLSQWMGRLNTNDKTRLMTEIYKVLPKTCRNIPNQTNQTNQELVLLKDDSDSFFNHLEKWIEHQKPIIVGQISHNEHKYLLNEYRKAANNNQSDDPKNLADLRIGLSGNNNDIFYQANPQQAALVLREAGEDKCAKKLVELSQNSDQEDENPEKLIEIIRELGPNAFADAINAITSWEDCNRLLSLLAKSKENHPFLADTVGFLFKKSPDFKFEKLKISEADNDNYNNPNFMLLQTVLPHIHYPTLTYKLAKDAGLKVKEKNGGQNQEPTYKFKAENIINFCANFPAGDDGDAQRIKVFQSLGGVSEYQLSAKIAALMALQESDHHEAADYESLFFKQLDTEGRIEYLQKLVKIVQSENENPSKAVTKAANTLMTHLNTPYRVEALKTTLGLDQNNTLDLLVKATTQPSTAVLKYYLETCCASTDKFTQTNLDAILKTNTRNNPPDKFKETTQKQLGDAIAQLANPTQTELFVGQLEKIIDSAQEQQPDNIKLQINTIRFQALVHLIHQPDGVARGQRLLEELDRHKPESKKELVTVIQTHLNQKDTNQLTKTEIAKLKDIINSSTEPAAAATPTPRHTTQ